MALTSAQQITQLYVGYFNRAPDPEGLNYWIGRLNSGEMNVQQIAESFSEQPETLATYPFLRYPNLLEGDTKAFITEIYQNAFNRAPDAEGLDYWTAQLTSGAVPVGDFIASVLSGATNSAAGQDLSTLNNKTTVGLNYADAVAQANVQWTPESAHAVLDGVNDTQASVAAADAEIAAFVAGSQQDGETVQLTVGNDVLTANIFDAPLVNTQGNVDVPTLNPADVLTGVGDNPTLNAVLNGQLALSPTLKGIETLNLETVATTTLNAVKATGVKTIAHEAGAGDFDLTVRNLGSNAAIAVNNGAAGADTNIRFADSVVSGAADEANLTLTNNGTAQIASGVVNLRGETAGGFETINVTANGVNHLWDLGSDSSSAAGFLIGSTNALRTLNVDGKGSLNIIAALDNVTKIDASANEGGVNFAIDATVIADVIGGKGDDTFRFAAGLTNQDKVDGGEGDADVLSVSNANGIGAGNQVKNIEVLSFDGATAGIAFNGDNLGGITEVRINDGFGVNNYSLTNLAKGAEVSILTDGRNALNPGDTLGNVDIGVKGAATVGSVDSLTINLNQDTAADVFATDLTVGSITANNIETIVFDVGNTIAATTIAALNSNITPFSLTINDGVANAGLTITGNAGGAAGAQLIDASKFLGNLTLGNAGTGNNTIIGGAGNDVLNGGAGADSLTGGAGNDIYVINSRADTQGVGFAVTDTSTANIDKINGFTGNGAAAGDGIQLGTGADAFGVALQFTVATQSTVTAVTVANAGSITDLIASVQAETNAIAGADTAASTAAMAQIADVTVTGGSLAGRYLLVNNETAGWGVNDTVVSLVGVDGALHAADFSFV